MCEVGLLIAEVLGNIASERHLTIRTIAQILTWSTAAFCLLRGLPVLVEGWKFFALETVAVRTRKSSPKAA